MICFATFSGGSLDCQVVVYDMGKTINKILLSKANSASPLLLLQSIKLSEIRRNHQPQRNHQH